MKHFWSGDQETESAIYPRCPELSASVQWDHYFLLF